jgi:hypothetical protein
LKIWFRYRPCPLWKSWSHCAILSPFHTNSGLLHLCSPLSEQDARISAGSHKGSAWLGLPQRYTTACCPIVQLGSDVPCTPTDSIAVGLWRLQKQSCLHLTKEQGINERPRCSKLRRMLGTERLQLFQKDVCFCPWNKATERVESITLRCGF